MWNDAIKLIKIKSGFKTKDFIHMVLDYQVSSVTGSKIRRYLASRDSERFKVATFDDFSDVAVAFVNYCLSSKSSSRTVRLSQKDFSFINDRLENLKDFNDLKLFLIDITGN